MKDIDPADTIAYLNSIADFYDDPNNEGKMPPPAPTVEIQMDAAAAAAKCVALIFDYQSNGSISSTEPSGQARLKAAAFIDEIRNRMDGGDQ